MKNQFFKKSPPFIIFLTVFLVYVHHLCPSIFGFDSGDFASAIITRGVPHASGYPLYTMFGILFSMLPVHQTIAWKIGLFSALSSAVSVVIIYLIIQELLENKILSIFSAYTVAFFYPFWLYSEVVEVLSLNSFFVLLLVFLAIKFHKTKKNFYIYLLSFVTGLSLTNNEVIILLFPAIFIVFLSNWKIIFKPATILRCIFLFTLGLTPYVYIPIAASFKPLINTDNAVSVQNFLHLVLRKDYSWGIVTKQPFQLTQLYVYIITLANEVGIPALVVTAIGVIYLATKKEFTVLLMLLAGFILTGPFFFIYSRTPLVGYFKIGQLERFVISSSILLYLILPYGIYLISIIVDKLLIKLAHKTSSIKRKSFLPIILLIFFIYPYHLFSSHYSSTDLHNVWIGDNLATDVLMSLPRNTVLLLYDDTTAYNTEYLQLAKNTRRDVFTPTDNPVLGKYIRNNKTLFTKVGTLLGRYKDLSDNKDSLVLLMFYSLKKPVFYLYLPAYDPEKYNKVIIFIPHGLLLKPADETDLRMSEKDFIKQQNKLLAKTHIGDLISHKNLIDTNYNFLYIRSVYRHALINTAIHLRYYYKDKKEAQVYIDKAKELDPNDF